MSTRQPSDYTRAIQLRHDGRPDDYANALEVRCGLETRTDHLEDARKDCEQALQIVRDALGPDHPLVAEAEINLGIDLGGRDTTPTSRRAIWETRARAPRARRRRRSCSGLATVLCRPRHGLARHRRHGCRRSATSIALRNRSSAIGRAPTRSTSTFRSAVAAPLARDRIAAAEIAAIEDIARRAEAALGSRIERPRTRSKISPLRTTRPAGSPMRERAFKRGLERRAAVRRSPPHDARRRRPLRQTCSSSAMRRTPEPLLEQIVLAVDRCRRTRRSSPRRTRTSPIACSSSATPRTPRTARSAASRSASTATIRCRRPRSALSSRRRCGRPARIRRRSRSRRSPATRCGDRPARVDAARGRGVSQASSRTLSES